MSWTRKLGTLRLKNLQTLLMTRTTSGDSSQNVADLLQDMQATEQNKKEKTDPDTTTVLLFAGQGSQKVGMADSFLQYPNVKTMFNAASDILKYDLLSLCQHGPKSELDLTVHCQPALLVTSLAAVEHLQETDPNVLEHCKACAGYSVGEYAALVFSGAISFEDAVALINVRAKAMQNACNAVSSEMVTAIGSASSKFRAACKTARDHIQEKFLIEKPVCHVSANLCTNTVTIAGHTEAINYLKEHHNEFEIRKIIPIPVSGAFHTNLMKPVSKKLELALKNVHIEEPLIKVYSNYTGKVFKSPQEIQRSLPLQVVRPVLWEQTMHAMFTRSGKINMPQVHDAGPGSQLGSLLRKCNGKAFLNYCPVNDYSK
uniref:Malonyl-CoA-acyl carrier protein transacylase, mitochondrial n=1 Tax=Phallusia mammillata TaxID=59560 RepID=A0A6F9DL20_9ASCI|nr:malonyl-CoA-acyl carrier protein transacylase, mitochondrial [Phallusia mammillata]